MFDLIIVGAGAAGLYAAANIEEKRVLIIDKNNEVGRKLLITGKGRCNITNNTDVEGVIRNIVCQNKFIYSALSKTPPSEVMNFFEYRGLALKTERGNRVFPESDDASDVVEVLRDAAFKYKENVTFKCAVVSKILVENGTACKVLLQNGEEISAHNILIATGGASYKGTGSTGDGYKFAKDLGHTIKEIRPSLIPIVTKERWVSELSGLSLKNVTLKAICNDKTVFFEQGEMLFTHFGISGPLVLSASALIPQGVPCKLFIDLKPALSPQQLDKRVLRDFNEFQNKDFKNSLSKLLPASFVDIFVELSGIDGLKKVNLITKEERGIIVALLKSIPLNLSKFRPIDEAIITRGGISTDEVNPKTLESKIVRNLFFAGEVLDIDGYTGGFNLQIAFATAAAVASEIERR